MIINTLDQTQALATELAPRFQAGETVFLKGTLGAGKTTLVRMILESLGVTARIKSPTYTLVEQYDVADMTVYHMDLYRLNDPFELEEMGWREYFHEGALCFIEWPEKAGDVLPKADWVIRLGTENGQRTIEIDYKDAPCEY